MVYIEFYSQTVIDNICATLNTVSGNIGRIIFVTNDSKRCDNFANRYVDFLFNYRGIITEYEIKSVPIGQFDLLKAELTGIIEMYGAGNCVFDITGGDEMSLLAVGELHTTYPAINICKCAVRKGECMLCRSGETDFVPLAMNANLTLDQHILIHGGKISNGYSGDNPKYKWDESPNLISVIKDLWNMNSTVENVSERLQPHVIWNAVCNHISYLISRSVSNDGNSITCKGIDYNMQYMEVRDNTNLVKSRFNELKKKGYFTVKQIGKLYVIEFRNSDIMRLLSSPGTLLEFMVYYQMKELNKYNDVQSNVIIDWDGEIHTDGTADTQNEVDVMAIRGLSPVFISCKNGSCDMNELYKLSAVAERFGGKYATKCLILAGEPTGDKETHVGIGLQNRIRLFEERCGLMRIRLIRNACTMSADALKERLMNLQL